MYIWCRDKDAWNDITEISGVAKESKHCFTPVRPNSDDAWHRKALDLWFEQLISWVKAYR